MTRIQEIFKSVKTLAVEYYELTGKPLGVTGEIAEHEAAMKLGLELVDPRNNGFDAIRKKGNRIEKIEIKGRRKTSWPPYVGRVSRINIDVEFDFVELVLLDDHFDVVEIWEAPYNKVCDRLLAPGSKSRNERYSMSVSQFRSIAERVWSRA